MKIDIKVECDVSGSTRVRQLGSMFDCPVEKKASLTWQGELPIEGTDWNVGLIVGPSGCGKSTIARNLFKEHFDIPLEWKAKSVIDDFAPEHSIQEISEVCQAVGFSTIPAWMRPYSVLSNGERFRVDIARRLLELPSPIVVDEFSSVVDRQVAKIGAHAVQKFVRKNNRQFVAVSCHTDILDWLNPDWVFEPGLMAYAPRGLLQRRPELECTIARVPYAAWQLFAPFHYLSANLHRAARCYGLWVEGSLATFCGTLHRPHPVVRDITGVSRIVTLPDWQGLGLAFALLDRLGAAYKALGRRFRNYPAHPGFIRSHQKSPNWRMTKQGGFYSHISGNRLKYVKVDPNMPGASSLGGRPCAVFEYCGPAMDLRDAQRLIAVV
jgi:ABC-type molybdenum transport system ATPase subunit/photorepair protein PhrA